MTVVSTLPRRSGIALEPFQRRIVRAVDGPQRETLILIPRGHGRRR